MSIFKRKTKIPPKPIMARFIYQGFYKESKSEWQQTTTRELNNAISKNESMFDVTIKLGNLYQPSRIVQGFEVKEIK